MHWLLDPITKHYADFSGRASRQQYWMFFLLLIVVFFGLGTIAGMLVFNEITYVVFSSLMVILGLSIIIPNLALSVRRLHDIGKSGWWYLVIFIPLVGPIILLVFMVLPSQPGPNKYGPNPLGTTSVATEAESPLMTAVQERIQLGYDDEKITAELRQSGYDDATIQNVITQARAQSQPPTEQV